VLEFGSGVGELLVALATERPELRFTGVEPQQSYVDFSSERAARRGLRNLEFRTSTAERAPEILGGEGGGYDWILSNDMLHHVPAYGAVLEAAARSAQAGARWLAIEPNWRNPYVLIGCAVKRGERNFWPRRFLAEAAAAGWSLRDRAFLFLVPPFWKRPPDAVIRLERVLERNPVLAGGVALTLALERPSGFPTPRPGR
jgi:SAM-dependent methyltransferase